MNAVRPKTWRIRPEDAPPFPIEALARLHASCFEDRGRAWSAAEIAAMRDDAAMRWVEAAAVDESAAPDVSDTELIGFALIRIVLDEAELLTICRNPLWAGHGLGKALLNSAMKRARSLSAATMFLEVAPGNRHACDLYDTLGFRQVGRRSRYYRLPEGGAEDALVLQAELTLP